MNGGSHKQENSYVTRNGVQNYSVRPSEVYQIKTKLEADVRIPQPRSSLNAYKPDIMGNFNRMESSLAKSID